MSKRGPSLSESRHMARVAELGCVVCRNAGFGQTPAQVHHLREGQGMSQRADNWLVIPLCREHHQGADSIHGCRDAFQRRYGSELDLLAQTISEVYG